MFAWWGRTVVRVRWVAVAMAIATAVVGAVWGTGVVKVLTSGGFTTPGSDSARITSRIITELGRQDFDVITLYSSPSSTVDDGEFRNAVTSTVARLRDHREVASVSSYYDTGNPDLVSTDRHATFALIRLSPSDGSTRKQFEAIRAELVAPGLRTEIGGNVAISSDIDKRVSRDIGRAEAVSMPILLILLIFAFRSLLAAIAPLLVGGLAILGSFIVTRVLTYYTEVSVFALNIITLLSLGMAIDYSLFVVGRFREELAAGRPVRDAVLNTVVSAGRTVVVSGLTVAIAVSSLLLFPQDFLRSMGYGAIAAVLTAMVASLTVLPALLAIVGLRIGGRRLRRRHGREIHFHGRRPAAAEGQAWSRIAHAVMRRPVLVVLATTAVLATLATPVRHIQFGGVDERVLPAGTESRVVSERIKADFPHGSVDHIQVLVSGADQPATTSFATRIAGLPHVTGAAVTANRGQSSLVLVSYEGASGGSVARTVVTEIRDLPAPDGAKVLVGGSAADTADLLASLASHLPQMALMVIAATFLLLFLAFGSVLLPIKAVLMNVISLGAGFGAVVWVFQDGHFADRLGFTSTGFIEATQPVLMLAILFGLATDYEVFLLSRVREEWDRTGDNTAAVARGLARTGRIITWAALLLIVVIFGFATGGITFIKMIGVGMIVAIAVDATIVRALLVPATMRLMGRANWWAPGPLRRLYGRYGIRETSPAAPVAPVPPPEAALPPDPPGGTAVLRPSPPEWTYRHSRTTFRRLMVTGPGRAVLVEDLLPRLGDGEVCARTVVSGLTNGTDVAWWTSAAGPDRGNSGVGRNHQKNGYAYPILPGNETVAIVVDVAPDVYDVEPGDLVYLDRPHADRHIVDARTAKAGRLPSGTAADRALFWASARIALGGVYDAGIQIGDTVVVVGLDTVGLLAAQLAFIAGARQVIGVDRYPRRMASALSLDIQIVHATADTDVAADVRQLTGARGADAVIEASGSYRGLTEAIRCCGIGGRVATVASYPDGHPGPSLGEAYHSNRVRLISSMTAASGMGRLAEPKSDELDATARELLCTGRLRVEDLITHRVPFKQAGEAYALLSQKPGATIKVVLTYP